MKRFLSGGLMMVGMASLPMAVSSQQVGRAPASEHRDDPRLIALQQFFAKDACPAAQFAGDFLLAADTFALDWRLLPSISYVESAGGKTLRNNNMFGWDSGRAQFPSLAAGIHRVAYSLSHSDHYRNKSLDRVLATYNPDAGYARLVKSVMKRIAPIQ